MKKMILFCTVGGSHEPILKALSDLIAPFEVCFFCTEDSIKTVNGGNTPVIKKHPDCRKPTLPSIPEQANLPCGSWKAMEVPADDFDACFSSMREAIEEHVDSGSDIFADYTGGTKTMAAALVTAALDLECVRLQLVTGDRSNMRVVIDGTESVVDASVAATMLDRAIRKHLSAWERYAYGEAANGLKGIRRRADLPSKILLLARTMSEAFDLWDRFDHARAWSLIRRYRGSIGRSPTHRWIVQTLPKLARKDTPMLLVDLWRNAERRAEQGRYDDAVARWYRLVEWFAQWQLSVSPHKLDTSKFPCDMLPSDADVRVPGHLGNTKIGLMDAWRAVRDYGKKTAGNFAEQQLPNLQNMVGIRNRSILAHGFEPIKHDQWCHIRDWTTMHLIPLVLALGKLKGAPQQLPKELARNFLA